MNAITLNGENIGISVSVYLFVEDNMFIAYCPSLDLTGYDTTEEAAKSEFEYILKEWLEEQIANGTLNEDLKRHGWTLGENGGKEPDVKSIITRGGSASRVFSMPNYRKTCVHTKVHC